MRRFRERYRLARIRDEAILLNLDTGSYFGVQGTALAVCDALAMNASVARAASYVAKKFDVSRGTAARDVSKLLASLRKPRRSSPASPFRVRPKGYELRDSRGGRVMLAHDGTVTHAAGSHLLRLAAPHALALRGETVLHASAILDRGSVLAFVGASGVGKTTIAKTLQKRARSRISEDLVVMDGDLRVRDDGERAIRAWTRKRSRAAQDHPLATCAKTTRPIGAVLLVERIAGLDRVRIERAKKIEGMAMLFENAFIELPAARVWEHALDVSRRLVARGVVYRMQVPEGRAALTRALEEWSPRDLARR